MKITLKTVATSIMILSLNHSFCADKSDPNLLDIFIPKSLVNDGRIPPLHVDPNNQTAGNKQQRGYLAQLVHSTLKRTDPDYFINYYTAEGHINHTENVLSAIADNKPWETKLSDGKTLQTHWAETINARNFIEQTILGLICDTEHHADTNSTTIKYDSVNKFRRLLAANRHILSPDVLLASRMAIESFMKRHGEKAFFPDTFSSILITSQQKKTPSIVKTPGSSPQTNTPQSSPGTSPAPPPPTGSEQNTNDCAQGQPSTSSKTKPIESGSESDTAPQSPALGSPHSVPPITHSGAPINGQPQSSPMTIPHDSPHAPHSTQQPSSSYTGCRPPGSTPPNQLQFGNDRNDEFSPFSNSNDVIVTLPDQKPPLEQLRVSDEQ